MSLALILPAYHLFAQRCDREDTVPARVALFHSNVGTEPTDEYTPIGADNDLLSQQTDPPYWLFPEYPDLDKPIISFTPNGKRIEGFCTCPLMRLPDNSPPPLHIVPGQAPTHLTLDLPESEYLVLNRRAYPFWDILLNGKPLHPVPEAPWKLPWTMEGLTKWVYGDFGYQSHRRDGLIVVELKGGHSTIDLVYHHTFDQTIGLIISALALLIALIVARKNSRLSASRLIAEDS